MDGICRVGLEAAPRAYVAYFLTTSYCYYQLDYSVISDGLYDEICNTLYERWDEIEHEHKGFINRDDLKAGTGFNLPFGEFPASIKGAATALIAQARGKFPPTSA